MKDSQEENNEKPESKELEKYQKISENANDMTDILFDLFFDKDFQGNTQIDKDSEGKSNS